MLENYKFVILDLAISATYSCQNPSYSLFTHHTKTSITPPPPLESFANLLTDCMCVYYTFIGVLLICWGLFLASVRYTCSPQVVFKQPQWVWTNHQAWDQLTLTFCDIYRAQRSLSWDHMAVFRLSRLRSPPHATPPFPPYDHLWYWLP